MTHEYCFAVCYCWTESPRTPLLSMYTIHEYLWACPRISLVGKACANVPDFCFEINSFGFNTLKFILHLKCHKPLKKKKIKRSLCLVKEIKRIIVLSLLFPDLHTSNQAMFCLLSYINFSVENNWCSKQQKWENSYIHSQIRLGYIIHWIILVSQDLPFIQLCHV